MLEFYCSAGQGSQGRARAARAVWGRCDGLFVYGSYQQERIDHAACDLVISLKRSIRKYPTAQRCRNPMLWTRHCYGHDTACTGSLGENKDKTRGADALDALLEEEDGFGGGASC